jgi:sulfur-carrier protein adenylyltransferase/sulfurtransferase
MTLTYSQILYRAQKSEKEIKADELKNILSHSSTEILLDIRESEEIQKGTLPNAKILPRGYLEIMIEKMVPNKDASITLYCAGGIRSILAAETLSGMGYTQLKSLKGGFNSWKAHGFPIDRNAKSLVEKKQHLKQIALGTALFFSGSLISFILIKLIN